MAWAELMQTSGSLAPGHVKLGAEIQIGFHPGGDRAGLNIHESFGLAGGLDLYGRQGIGINRHRSLYLGAGVKWTILYDKKNSPGLAFLGGGHLYYDGGGGGVDLTLLLDNRFGRITPFVALDLNIEYGDGNAEMYLSVVGGARVDVVRNVDWFAEGGFGLAGEPRSHFAATGLQITI